MGQIPAHDSGLKHSYFWGFSFVLTASLAVALGMEPAGLMIAAAMSSSLAFMLPVATPPNAIVFGTGYVTIPQMARAGLWMNLLCIAIITSFITFMLH